MLRVKKLKEYHKKTIFFFHKQKEIDHHGNLLKIFNTNCMIPV